MRGALNMAQLTLACALGWRARNPDFDWRSGSAACADWYRADRRASLLSGYARPGGE
jgi:hypothetical protein